VLLLSGMALGDETSWNLALEAGGEFDSNVHRTTGGAVAATGGRTAGRFELSLDPTAKTVLKLDALAAGKAYAGVDPSSENIGVVAGDATFVGFVGAVAPGVRVSYYDAYQAHDSTSDDVELHDFRTGDASATLTLLAGANRITASAGGRFFTYKPDATFDFSGEVFGVAWARRLAGGADEPTWDLGVAYTIDRRRYDAHALASLCTGSVQTTCLVDAGMQRSDLFHDAGVELTYTGKRIFAARYDIQINDSNSFGQSLMRHRLDLSATSETFAEIYVTLRLVLQLDQYTDGLLLGGDLGTFTTIEDETRNSIVVHATRQFGGNWTGEARYAFYTNPFAADSTSYSRHTLYFGAVYTFRSATF
jgi:hypothetical protein